MESESAATAGSATHSSHSATSKRGRPYRVLLVDDHPVVRRGIRAIVESQRDMEVCGEASDGHEALELAGEFKPDLMLVDLTMAEMNGLDVTAAVREQFPEIEVLVLSMHFSEELAREVLRCGALGYILKSDADEELLAALDHMRRHQPFFTGRLAFAMTQNFVDGTGSGTDANGKHISPLTERELQVVKLLAEGRSN